MYRLKGTSGPVINQAFPLQGRLTIGGAADCDIRIPTAAGSAAELTLEAQGRVVFREVAAGLAATVNGEPVTERQLRSGDELRIGPCAFLLQAPGRRPERVLHEAEAAKRRSAWPWVLAAAVVAAALLLAWRNGWLML